MSTPRRRLFRLPFPAEIELNPFCDYDELVMLATRDAGGVVSNIWHLKGHGLENRILSEREVVRALTSIFMLHAIPVELSSEPPKDA